MVATSDRRLAQRVRDLREYDNRDDHALRFNFKLTDMQAAIARVQLRRLPDMIRRRRAAADRYGRVLARTGVALPCIDESCEPMFYRYVVGVSRGAAGLVRRARGKGIALSRPVYRPLHRYVGRSGFTGTDRIYRRAVSLPIYPDIGRAEQQAVVDTLCGLVAGQR
jgi:perosamine synthetase